MIELRTKSQKTSVSTPSSSATAMKAAAIRSLTSCIDATLNRLGDLRQAGDGLVDLARPAWRAAVAHALEQARQRADCLAGQPAPDQYVLEFARCHGRVAGDAALLLHDTAHLAVAGND